MTPKGHAAHLDAIRGAAALMVMSAHARQLTGGSGPRTGFHASDLVEGGLAQSVHVFFALSGYLVGGPFLRALVEGSALPERRSYALRRGARIFPAYWIALAAIVVFGPAIGAGAAWRLPVHGLLLQDLVPGEYGTIDFVAWTLSIEVVFYLTLPIVAAFVRRRHPGPISVTRLATWLVTGWVALNVAAPLVEHVSASGTGRSLVLPLDIVYDNLLMFVPGMVVFLAELRHRTPDAGEFRIHRWLTEHPVAALTTAAGCFVAGRLMFTAHQTELALRMLPLSAVAAGLLLGVVVHRAPSGPIVRLLAAAGVVSYGIYLWHWVIVTLIKSHDVPGIASGYGPGPWVQDWLVLFSLTIVAAIISWRAVERPLIERARVLSKRWEPKQPLHR